MSLAVENRLKNVPLPGLLWGLLGPLMAAGALMVIGIRGLTAFWELPLLGIAGIFFCYQFKWRGMLCASALLLMALAYRLTLQPSSEWLWLTVLVFSFISTFVVSVLAVEESGLLWQNLFKEIEDQRALAQIWHERSQVSQDRSKTDLQEMQAQIDRLHSELFDKQEHLLASEKLVNVVKNELSAVQGYQEKLLEELFDARQQLAQKENEFLQKNEEKQETAEQSLLIESQRLVIEREREIEELKWRLQKYATLERNSLQLSERFTAEKQSLETTIDRLQNELEATKSQQKYQLDDLQIRCQEALLAKEQSLEHLIKLKEELNSTTSEKQQLEITISRLQDELETTFKQQKIQMENLKTECRVALLAKEQDKQSLEHLVKLHEDLKATIGEKHQEPESRDVRRLQGLYQQLREQFAQKSAVLDETRRQLFHTQEKLWVVQHELTQPVEEETSGLMRLLARAENEFARQEMVYKQEISSLENIIASLINEQQEGSEKNSVDFCPLSVASQR